MKYFLFLAILSASAFSANVQQNVEQNVQYVQGHAEGFASGVTGGGNVKPVFPTNITQLAGYLSDPNPQVIVLTKKFNFTGSEGQAKGRGCAPWGVKAGCDVALDYKNWCQLHEPHAPMTNVYYDKAGAHGMVVKSNKSLVGLGKAGVIVGKGIIITGAKNVIIQNVRFTEINPHAVWAGDAITIEYSTLVWIDHVSTDLIGRQHMVLGEGPAELVTISNCDISGLTEYSTTCDSYHYWAIYLSGRKDFVTMKDNSIHHTCGRSPKIAEGKTFVHMVNNYFSDIRQHAFEGDADNIVVAEGNLFENVTQAEDESKNNHFNSQMFAATDKTPNEKCKKYLGYACQPNVFVNSGVLNGHNENLLTLFKKNYTIKPAVPARQVKKDPGQFGYGMPDPRPTNQRRDGHTHGHNHVIKRLKNHMN